MGSRGLLKMATPLKKSSMQSNPTRLYEEGNLTVNFLADVQIMGGSCSSCRELIGWP